MLEDLVPKPRATKCLVIRLAAELDESDKVIFLNAVANDQLWSASGLSTALKAKNLRISDLTITRHRRGVCGCYAI